MKKTTLILLAVLAALLILVSCNESVDYVLDLPKTTPLSLEFIEAGTLKFTNKPACLKYSKNGGEITAAPASIPVESGDVISLYATRTEAGTYLLKIKCTSDCYVYGNVMSLIDEEKYATKTDLYPKAFRELFLDNSHIKNHPSKKIVLPATTLAEECYEYMFHNCFGITEAPVLPATTLAAKCYYGMFYGCKGLTKAPELPSRNLAKQCYDHMFYGCTGLTEAPVLPATTLAENCYQHMFAECSGLTKAPELPATTLAAYCYRSMFNGCSKLTEAPELPATTLADNCYWFMFYGCTSLTTTPVLHAPKLVKECYRSMFNGCTNLSSVTCLATDISAENATTSWLYQVASQGTFTKASSMDDWTTGTSGIPSGWTVKEQ